MIHSQLNGRSVADFDMNRSAGQLQVMNRSNLGMMPNPSMPAIDRSTVLMSARNFFRTKSRVDEVAQPHQNRLTYQDTFIDDSIINSGRNVSQNLHKHPKSFFDGNLSYINDGPFGAGQASFANLKMNSKGTALADNSKINSLRELNSLGSANRDPESSMALGQESGLINAL